MATSTTASTSATLPAYKTDFLQACLSGNVLTFGSYTLKSGRQSPYFFNAGSLHTAPLLSSISVAYAHTIQSFIVSNPSLPKPDVLFGPAYKGIPLVAAALLELHRLDPETWSTISYSFNRKEVKDHGEGGNIVGASLKGKNILVIDDVVTAGTAMRETMKLVEKEGGKVIGLVVALDRGEKMPATKEGEEDSRMSAIGQIKHEFGVQAASIATLDDLIALVRASGDKGDLERLEEYRKKYRASD